MSNGRRRKGLSHRHVVSFIVLWTLFGVDLIPLVIIAGGWFALVWVYQRFFEKGVALPKNLG